MAQPAVQTFENHARIVPVYHIGAFGILAINFLWTAYRMTAVRTVDSVVTWLVAVALLIVFFCARVFALTVQDRVIRLEMRLRLAEVLPADLRARIPELTVPQFVSLRFASDAELPLLVRKVLDDRITDRKTIKKMITSWQADFLRA